MLFLWVHLRTDEARQLLVLEGRPCECQLLQAHEQRQLRACPRQQVAAPQVQLPQLGRSGTQEPHETGVHLCRRHLEGSQKQAKLVG